MGVLVWVHYSRKRCRRESSHTTYRPWECQGCQKTGRFYQVHYGAERTSVKPRSNHGKIPTENFRWLCWKKLEDIKNSPENAVLVPAEDHIRLIEQIVLPLDQPLDSILHSRRLQILNAWMKVPQKAKNTLKEKADLFQKIVQNLFSK